MNQTNKEGWKMEMFNTYWTKNFSDIYPDLNKFEEDYTFYQNAGLNPNFDGQDTIKTIYCLLLSRYGNSTIANMDENQFKLKLFSTIFQYGPTWEKRLNIQSDLRALSLDELQLGTTQVHNHSYNPGTQPSTQTLDELTTIDDQNVVKYKKSKMDSYANLMALLEKDVTEEFLGKFKKLFIYVVAGQKPLWYITQGDSRQWI